MHQGYYHNTLHIILTQGYLHLITKEEKGEYNDPHGQHPRVFFPEWKNFTRSQSRMAAKCIFNNLQEWGNNEEADTISQSTCRAKEIGLIFICYGPVPVLRDTWI